MLHTPRGSHATFTNILTLNIWIRRRSSEWVGEWGIAYLVNERPRDVGEMVLRHVDELFEGMEREAKIAEIAFIANVGQLDGDGLVPVWS